MLGELPNSKMVTHLVFLKGRTYLEYKSRIFQAQVKAGGFCLQGLCRIILIRKKISRLQVPPS